MSDVYVAKANVVKVSIGALDGNRVARIIRRGGVIPEGVNEASLKDLAKRGLIAPVKPAVSPAATAQAQAEADAAAKAQADAAAESAAAAKAEAAATAKAKAAGK